MFALEPLQELERVSMLLRELRVLRDWRRDEIPSSELRQVYDDAYEKLSVVVSKVYEAHRRNEEETPCPHQ